MKTNKAHERKNRRNENKTDDITKRQNANIRSNTKRKQQEHVEERNGMGKKNIDKYNQGKLTLRDEGNTERHHENNEKYW